MADSPTSKRIPELDGLRGIAIALVVSLHYFYFDPYAATHKPGIWHEVYVVLQRFIGMGWTGVDLFFILSGFLIGGILLESRNSPRYYRTFYLRRMHRILPLYYVWILAYVATMAVAGGVLAAHLPGRHSWATPQQFAELFLFLQNFGAIGGSVVPVLWFQHTWSLAVEEQFYLAAPFLVRVLTRRALVFFLAMTVVLAPALRLWIHYHLHPASGGLELAYILMPCRADTLAIGILAAILWHTEKMRAWMLANAAVFYVLFAVLLAGFAALAKWAPAYDSLPMIAAGYTWNAAFYASAVLLVLIRPATALAAIARTGWLRKLGQLSYCLYLIHLVISMFLQILLQMTVKHADPWQIAASNVVALACCCAVAQISWTYFEYPLIKRGHTYRY